MADYRVTLTVDGRDQASGVVRGLTNELDRAQAQTRAFGGEMAGASQQSGGLIGRLGGVTGVVSAAAGAFAAWQIGEKVLELRDLGAEATAAENTFVQLSGGAEIAARNLDMMRTTTRGVVDDMTLMSGANRLLLMGLAETGDEAAQLTAIATSLGRAMGMDAAASVSDFAALLANQSMPRLDQFGISSARVRARLEELQATMGREDAFRLAVLEQGTAAMDRLGGSIDANTTAWDRMSTRLQNAIQDIGQFVAAAIEGAAAAAEGVLAQAERVREENAAARTEVEQTLAVAEQAGQEMSTAFTSAFSSDTFPDASSFFMVVSDAVGRFQEETGRSVETVDDLNEAMYRFGGGIQLAAGEMEAALYFLENGVVAAERVAESQLAASVNAGYAALRGREYADQLERQARIEAGQADSRRQQFQQAREHRQEEDMWQALAVRREEERLALQEAEIANYAQMAENFQARQREADAAAEVTAQVQLLLDIENEIAAMPGMINPDELIRAAQLQEESEGILESIQAAADAGLIDDDVLNRARLAADTISELKDSAVESRNAFREISLTELFGQHSGGLMGEVTERIAEQMEALGATQDQIAAFQQQADLASGRQTDASVMFEEVALPALAEIADRFGPEMGARAAQAVSEYLVQSADDDTQITAEGIRQALQESGFMMGVGGAGRGGQQFTVSAGQTPGEVAAMLGISVDELLGITGAPNARAMRTGTYSMPGASVGMAQGFNYMAGVDFGMGGGMGGYADFMDEDTVTQIQMAAADTAAIATDTTTWSEAYQIVRDTIPEITGGLDESRESVAGVREEAAGLAEDLAGIAGQEYMLRFNVVLSGENLALAQALLSMAGAGGGLAGVVQENYGVVPGVDPRQQAYNTVR